MKHRKAHTAIITPGHTADCGQSADTCHCLPDYLVTCPHGCNLGESARQPTREGAERRVKLHADATTPLTISPETIAEVARVGREYPDGIHTCEELQRLEPGRRPCTCGRCGRGSFERTP